jgi:hypothetical protein
MVHHGTGVTFDPRANSKSDKGWSSGWRRAVASIAVMSCMTDCNLVRIDRNPACRERILVRRSLRLQPPLRLPLAGPVPLRRRGLSGGSTQRAPHAAADARSAETAAGRGSPPPAPTSPAHCPAASGTFLDRCPCTQQTRTGTAAKPEAQTASEALRVGAAWRSAPHRRQNPGPLP